MSRNAVDERMVASLEMNNSNFEKNAKTSLSTIERLKKALDFSGNTGAKSFHLIAKAANLPNKAIEDVSTSASKLGETLGKLTEVAAFSMIADEAIKAKNAVTGFIKSVTVDQVADGWQKYADKTSAVQTIMAATAKDWNDQGAQMEWVNEQLDKLNWFTDETSYNFLDMVGSIGKFTSNLIPLETSVTAMEGIATWAAKSGAGVNEASRAMYNLSQAIAVGSVKLMDWKSIENANMSTAEFKQTAIEAAEAVGTLTKVEENLWKTQNGSEVSVQNFNEALKDEWFTADVLLKTLDKYGAFSDKLHKYMQEMNSDVSTSDVLGYIDDFNAGTLELNDAVDATGLSASRLKEILTDLGSDEMKFGREAFVAAQAAITFQQAIDSVKDAASTAWMGIFETLFGNFLEAKELWTDLANNLWDVFVGPVDSFKEALQEGFGQTEIATARDLDKLTKAGLTNPAYIKRVREVLKEHGVTVANILSDEEALTYALEHQYLSIGDLQEAFKTLGSSQLKAENVDEDLKKRIEEGDESIQDHVDKIKELSSNYSTDDIMGIIFGNGQYDNENKELEAEMDALISALGLSQTEGEKLRDVLIDLGVFTDSTTKSIMDLSEEELKNLGYTQDQIDMIQKVKEEGGDLNKLFDDLGINAMTGADHWTNGLNNIMNSILGIIGIAGEEWSNVFPDVEGSDIYEFTKAFDDITSSIRDFVENDENNTLHNVFHAIAESASVVTSNMRLFISAIGGAALTKGVGLVLKLVGGVGKLFAKLKIAASIFEFFRGFLEGLGIDGESAVNTISNLITKFAEWFKALDPIGKALDLIRGVGRIAGTAVRGFFTSFKSMPQVRVGLNQIRVGFSRLRKGLGEHIKDGGKRIEGFIEKVKEMGGLKFDNLGEVFKMARDELLAWIKEIPGLGTIVTGFQNIWAGFIQKLRDMGVPVDDIAEKFKSLKKGFSSFPSVLSTVGHWISTFASDLWNDFLSIPFIQNAITNFGSAFDTIKESFGTFTEGLKTRWDEFVQKVEDLGGFKFENIGEIFEMFKEDIISYITNWEGFTAIKDAFGGLWTDIKAQLKDSLGFDIDDIAGGITNFFSSLRTALEEQGITFPTSLDEIPEFITKIGDAISSLEFEEGSPGEAVFNALKFVFEKLFDFIGFVQEHWQLFMWAAVIVIGLKKLDMIVSDIRKHFDAINKELKARAFLETAAGIALIAFAIWIVVQSFMDIATTFGQNGFVDGMSRIGPGLIAMVAILGMLAIVFHIVGKMKVDSGQIWGIAATIAAFWVLSQAFKSLAKMNDDEIWRGFQALGLIGLVLSGLMGVVALVNKFGGEKAGENLGPALKGLAYMMAALAALIVVMALVPKNKLEQIKWTIVWLVGALAVLMLAMGTANRIGGAGTLDSVVKAINAIRNIMIVFAAMVAAVVVGDMLTGGAVTRAVETLQAAFLGLAAIFVAAGVLTFLTSKSGGAGALFANLMTVAGSIAIIIAAVTAIAGVIGYIVNEFDLADEIETGLEALENVVTTIARCIGAVIEAILGAIGNAINNLLGGRTPIQILVDDIAYLAETFGSDTFKQNVEAIGNIQISDQASDNLKALLLAGFVTSIVGLINAVATAISAITSWITDGDAQTAIESLVNDMAFMYETFCSSDFVNNVNGVAALNFDEGASDNLKALLLAAFVSDIVALINAVVTGLSAITSWITDGDAQSGIESLVNDVAYMYETFSSSDFVNNVNGVAALNFDEGASDSLKALLLAAVVSDIVALINDIVTGISAITSWITDGDVQDGIESLVNDVAYMYEMFGSSDFAQNVNNLAALNFDSGASDNLKALLLGAVVSDIVSLINDITTAISAITSWITDGDAQSSIESLVNDVTFMYEMFGSTDFAEDVNNLAALNFDEGASDNLKALLLGDIFSAVAGVSTSICDAITGTVSWLTDGDAKGSVEKMVDDVALIYSTFGDDTFQEQVNKVSGLTIPTTQLKELSDSLVYISWGEFVSSVIDWLTPGEGDPISTMTEKATTLTEGLKTWAEKMDEIDELAGEDGIKVPVDAITALSEAIGTVTTQGLWDAIKDWLGVSKDVGEFKENVGILGEAVQEFVTSLGEDTDVSKLRTASRTLISLATIASKMQILMHNVEWAEQFSGVMGQISTALNNFAGLGEKGQGLADVEMISGLSESVAQLFSAMAEISGITFEGDIMDGQKVITFETGIARVITSIESLADMNTTGVDKLKDSIDTLSKMDLGKAVESASGDSSKEAADQSKKIGGALASNVNSSENAAAMSGAVTGLMSTALSAVKTDQFTGAGADIASKLASGIARSSKVSEAMVGIVYAARNAIDTGALVSTGKYTAEGFAEGLARGAITVAAAAYALALAAKLTIERTLKVGSPAKVAIDIGEYVGDGFAIGLENRQEQVSESAASMANSAISGIRTAVATINTVMEESINGQPVIRPILDLSNIQNGAYSIGRIITDAKPVGMFDSFDTISGTIERRKGRATIEDTLAAIASLERNGAMSKTINNYAVDGVTYDDGSNIADAVKTLVRATKIRRRV